MSDEVRLTSFGKKLRATSIEGKAIIGQITESHVNQGLCEDSPIPFYTDCSPISNRNDLLNIDDRVALLAENQG